MPSPSKTLGVLCLVFALCFVAPSAHADSFTPTFTCFGGGTTCYSPVVLPTAPDVTRAYALTPYCHPLPTHAAGPTREGSIEFSPAFKKTAANIWDRSRRGVDTTEFGTYIGRDGAAGPISEHATGSDFNPSVKIRVPNDALAVLHSHPNRSTDRPSQADVDAAKSNKKVVYVASRSGLWAAGPDGRITQVFSDPGWAWEKNPK
jgi:hypothetical protein